jgi:uncharacterized protein YcbK (DUF882 family)
MRLGPLSLAGCLALATALVVPATGEGGGEAIAGKSKKSKSKSKTKKSKRGKKDRYFSGHGVDKEELRTTPVSKPSGDVWLYSANFREEVKVNIYDASGGFDDEALAQLDHIFRCKRTGEQRAVDPRLYETVSVIQDHFGGKRIELVSGFRFQEKETSRHFHASAADMRIEGVSIRELYDYAESLDTGGMGIGIYPRSGFVHVDWRAPGEPSYRWTDRSPPEHDSGGKRPSRRWRGKKPTS